MHSLLKEIVAEKEKEVAELKKGPAPFSRPADWTARRNFSQAISRPGRINLIAEIKFASPSAGGIREKSDPAAIARTYEQAGAAAISLLTDQKFFGGDLAFLPPVKKAVQLPVLRKDFILDEIQVEQSLAAGADAILLIARILPQKKLRDLLRMAQEAGLDALTEIHDRVDLEKALNCGAGIIGINNRNLDNFRISLQNTLDLAPHIPRECIKVSESGIHDPEDIQFLRAGGIQAVLIGTAIMKSGEILGKARELVLAGIER